jgi:hypothetical protein
LRHGSQKLVGRAPLVAAVAVLTLAGAGLASAAEAPPSIGLASVSVKRKPPTASVYLNFCASVGPRAAIITTETRRILSRVVARNVSPEPLGADLDRVYPRECVTRFLISWVVQPRLMGKGVYSVSFRVKDGYGQLSKVVGFSFNPGG